MLKHGLCLICLMLVVLTEFGCGKAIIPQVHLNEEFSLSIGQRAFLTEENIQLRLREVTEDSRCPRGVTCIWAGRATCIIEISRAGSQYQMSLTQSGLADEYSRERYEEYELAFYLTPYPEAGEKIPKDAYRLHLIISKPPEQTKIIGSIIAEPMAFEGKDVTIVGYYRGWDLLQEANIGPPVTRSDWVIKDSTGAIYVSASSEAKVPEGLRPDSMQDTTIILEVRGIVRVTRDGQPYVEAISIERRL